MLIIQFFKIYAIGRNQTKILNFYQRNQHITSRKSFTKKINNTRLSGEYQQVDMVTKSATIDIKENCRERGRRI